ncbi:MAG: histidine--tRNA ligase [Patescibacteria group bacterium]|nr:histidine--tRNA ligase [Patescibacteria group bacterium]MDD5172945.1 histidine--tRNA ligase [Patescibacteria group bacterium]
MMKKKQKRKPKIKLQKTKKILKKSKEIKKNKFKKLKTKKQKNKEPRKKGKYSPKILRGMKDILPEETKIWDFVCKRLTELAESYGFQKIETPVLEERALFEKSTGLSSDIVEKQMYQFTDRGGNSVVMRPEFTPGIVRSYIEQGMFNLPQPIKFFCFGPLFRYERPQAGRLRQLHQFNFEVLGSAKPVVDAQLILFSQAFFNTLGLKVNIQINSLGCPSCRKSYRSKLMNYFRAKQKWLCPDCQRRLKTNPLRILDCQNPDCRELITRAPQLVDDLCSECQSHFVKVLEYLDEANVIYKLNPYLVRGLDYYTRTVFEFWPERPEKPINDSLLQGEEEKKITNELQEKEKELFSSPSALGGGGRYDNLVESLGGRLTPAAGFAYGLDRIIEEIKIQDLKVLKSKSPQIFLAQIGEVACRRALKLFEDLRKQGFKVGENLAKDSLKAQMEMANKLGVKLTLILGQQEILDKTIIIRDMHSGNQEIVDQEKIIKELKKRLK